MQHGHNATKYSVASHPLQQLDFDQNLPIFPKSLVQVQYHAAKFFATSCPILHATEFFVTPHLILGTLFHVLKMLAIESQKLISNTSDVVDAKVITNGEHTTPSLLIPIFPSINVFFAGDSQQILCKPVDLDNLDIDNGNVYELGILPMKPCPTIFTRSLLAHHYDSFFKAYKGDYAGLSPENGIDNEGKQSRILCVAKAIVRHNASGETKCCSVPCMLSKYLTISLLQPQVLLWLNGLVGRWTLCFLRSRSI